MQARWRWADDDMAGAPGMATAMATPIVKIEKCRPAGDGLTMIWPAYLIDTARPSVPDPSSLGKLRTAAGHAGRAGRAMLAQHIRSHPSSR